MFYKNAGFADVYNKNVEENALEEREAVSHQIWNVPKVRSKKNKSACMKRFMNVREARGLSGTLITKERYIYRNPKGMSTYSI